MSPIGGVGKQTQRTNQNRKAFGSADSCLLEGREGEKGKVAEGCLPREASPHLPGRQAWWQVSAHTGQMPLTTRSLGRWWWHAHVAQHCLFREGCGQGVPRRQRIGGMGRSGREGDPREGGLAPAESQFLFPPSPVSPPCTPKTVPSTPALAAVLQSPVPKKEKERYREGRMSS